KNFSFYYYIGFGSLPYIHTPAEGSGQLITSKDDKFSLFISNPYQYASSELKDSSDKFYMIIKFSEPNYKIQTFYPYHSVEDLKPNTTQEITEGKTSVFKFDVGK